MTPDNDRAAMRYARMRSSDLQTRTDNGSADLYIEGYFSVFDSAYELWPGATEVVKPGAFAGVLHDDVRALINHNSDLVLGRTAAGTLTLREDDRGLWGSVKINQNDGDAMNLYARVQRGDVDQCSFGFGIEKETVIHNEDGSVRWEIEKVNPLYEVSVCTFPAYEETSVSARRADWETMQKRRAEAWRETQRKKLRQEET